jgi:hypothetical protein
MPEHMISAHPEKLSLSPVRYSHYVSAYFKMGDGIEASLCVCLSCRKGIMSNPANSAGSRWTSKHENSACKLAHNALYNSLKQQILDAKQITQETIPSVLAPPISEQEHVTEQSPVTPQNLQQYTAIEINAVTPQNSQDSLNENMGYIYCFSNISMPGIFKIGMTLRTPEERLKEANISNTWKPPTSYQIELSKYIRDPKRKETILHTLLSKFTKRINKRREFFKVSLDDVKLLFDLME